MTQSHLDTIDIDVIIGGQPLAGLSLDFSKIVVVDVLATAGRLGSPQTGMTSTAVGDNASKLALVSEGDDLSASPFAAGLGAAAKDVLGKIFAAARRPASVQVLSIDEAGGDTWGNIWVALQTAYPGVYGYILVTDQDSDIAAASTALAATGQPFIAFAGLNDIAVAGADPATWGATAVGALADAASRRLFLTYHDGNIPQTAGQADFAEYAAAYLTASFDTRSPGGNRILQATSALGALSPTQKTNLDANNINHALPYYTTETYMDPGNMQSGTAIYNITTADLLQNRMRNALAAVKSQRVAIDAKIPFGRLGQDLGVSALRSVVDALTSADHLMTADDVRALRDISKPAPYVKALAISAEDRTLRRLRFEVLAYSLADARAFKVTTYLQT